MIIIIMSLGPWLFSIFFGKGWRISGQYAQIFVWLAAIRLVVSPFNIVFTIFEKVKILAIWQVSFFIGILLSPIFKFLDFRQFILVLVILNSTFYIINYKMTIRVLSENDKNLSA